jgi:hypothetical protein
VRIQGGACRLAITDDHLGAQQGQDVQQLFHADGTRVALNRGHTGLHDAQALSQVGLRPAAGLAQGAQELTELGGERDRVVHGGANLFQEIFEVYLYGEIKSKNHLWIISVEHHSKEILDAARKLCAPKSNGCTAKRGARGSPTRTH